MYLSLNIQQQTNELSKSVRMIYVWIWLLNIPDNFFSVIFFSPQISSVFYLNVMLTKICNNFQAKAKNGCPNVVPRDDLYIFLKLYLQRSFGLHRFKVNIKILDKGNPQLNFVMWIHRTVIHLLTEILKKNSSPNTIFRFGYSRYFNISHKDLMAFV